MPALPKILCVGLNPAIDRRIALPALQLGQVNRATRTHPTAGGKAAHVAFAAKRLGADVRWMAFLGGAEGDACRTGVESEGITAIGVPISQSTRTNLELIEASGTVTEVLEPGPAITRLESEEFLKEFQSQIGDCPAVAISGSLPEGIAPGFYAELISIAKKKGCHVALDTSGPALVGGVAGRPDLIKPNRQELSELVGRQITTVEQAVAASRHFHETGIATVVGSLGGEGAVVVTRNGVLCGIPPKISVKSTVGSGDSFLAGWLVAEGEGKGPTECLRNAIACGTANCLADSPAKIDMELVRQFLAEVQIKRL